MDLERFIWEWKWEESQKAEAMKDGEDYRRIR